MPPLAQRNLFHDKVRLAVTLTGIVFSVVLIVVQLGLFIGFTTATSNLIDHSGADLWVTSKNVPYVEQGVAFSERKLNQVRAVEGVGDAGREGENVVVTLDFEVEDCEIAGVLDINGVAVLSVHTGRSAGVAIIADRSSRLGSSCRTFPNKT